MKPALDTNGQPVCAHCVYRKPRPRDGVCTACNSYYHRHGHWPPPDFLDRRHQADQQRLMQRRAG